MWFTLSVISDIDVWLKSMVWNVAQCVTPKQLGRIAGSSALSEMQPSMRVSMAFARASWREAEDATAFALFATVNAR
jgi:hypothetical protein